MLKINNPSTIPFDPETDVGYAFAKDGLLWYFGDYNTIEFSSQFPAYYSGTNAQASSIYGPFTRFMGTATIGNDL